MKLNALLPVCMIALAGCQPVHRHPSTETFVIEQKMIPGDGVVTEAFYYEDHILCYDDDKDRFFVVDTNFQRVDSLTRLFNGVAGDVFLVNDSLFILGSRDYCFLDKGFSIKKLSASPLKERDLRFGRLLYADPVYEVYNASAGEWGGTVYFMNRKTGRSYAYPAGNLTQVIRWKDRFILCGFLAHLVYHSQFITIDRPERLFDVTDSLDKICCNWSPGEDPMHNGWKKIDTQAGIRSYFDTIGISVAATFPYGNELYSIYSTDSQTVLARHEQDSLVTVDTVCDHRLRFYETTTRLYGNTALTCYSRSWQEGNEETGELRRFEDSGLILIRGNRIALLHFITPRTPEYY